MPSLARTVPAFFRALGRWWRRRRDRLRARGAAPAGRTDAARRGADAERLGRRGVRAAVAHLRRQGYRVLARRLRAPRGGGAGEVDVLALDGGTLVLVEVKATTGAPESALDRVDRRQRRRLQGAWARLARSPRLAALPRRLDVVAVGLGGRRAACLLHRGFGPLSR